MNLFELIMYVALSGMILSSIFLSFLTYTNLQDSLDRQLKTSYERLIQAI